MEAVVELSAGVWDGPAVLAVVEAFRGRVARGGGGPVEAMVDRYSASRPRTVQADLADDPVSDRMHGCKGVRLNRDRDQKM